MTDDPTPPPAPPEGGGPGAETGRQDDHENEAEGVVPRSSPLPPPTVEPGDSLFADRYVLGTMLGRGGTCGVYRAWDTRLQRYVAIKRLEPPLSEDEHARARFHREGRAIARLSHPHLVTLIDRGATETEEYLVFQYVQGRSLKEVIRTTAPMEPEDVGRIIGQIAEGLGHAHAAGIVHRDVKPQNILLDAEGRAKLTDFGIATGAELTRVTHEGAIVGSSRYMSPEQVQGRPVDQRSDLYSLGIVMYEMLAGEPPFQGSSIVEVGRQHVRDRPAPLRDRRPELSPDLERVVMRCLEKLPESRFQSMEELLGALVGLGIYAPEPVATGLFETLRRGRTRAVDAGKDWVPPPGTETPPPPELAPEVLSRASEAAAADRMEDSRADERLRRADIKRGRRERTGWRRLLPVALVLVLVAVVVVAIVWLTGDTPAPDVTGMDLNEARQTLAAEGLQLEVDAEQVLDMQQPAGTIVGQDPAAGEAAEQGTVRVVVTREPIPVAVSELKDYDPDGDNEERPELLPQLIDDKDGTGWSTESYRSADFGGLGKNGVGVDFRLESPATLLQIVSPSEGWTGQVLAAAAEGEELTPVAELTGGEQSIDLGGPVTVGRIWITSLAPGEDNRFVVQVAELRFFR